MIVAVNSHPAALQLGLMFGLAVLLFRPPRRTIIAWLAMAIFIIVLGLFRLA
jgi:hypothetical protein